MLSVAEAQKLVLEQSKRLPAESTDLSSASALGQVLAEDVVSDLDMPPFDKAMMDGYALRCTDLVAGQGDLRVIEEVAAGQMPQMAVGIGEASRIMTGAPMPCGADAVVMIERTEARVAGQIHIEDRQINAGKNIIRQGEEMKTGETILKAGMVLTPVAIALCAGVGRTVVQAFPRPVVAILSTGDELVPASEQPGPGRIRNSNGPMLAAQTTRAGGIACYLGIVKDRAADLRTALEEGLRSPILVLSGGVSVGKFDLVPGALEELGVRAWFHKVSMKPGKPVFFGTKTATDGSTTLVFGLPGNPISSLVCFELFTRPAIRCLAGHADRGPQMVQAALAKDYSYDSERPTYHPAWLEEGDRGWEVSTRPWSGSANLRALVQANAFVLLPAGNHLHRAGQRFTVLRLEG